jgi:hypothetical protein
LRFVFLQDRHHGVVAVQHQQFHISRKIRHTPQVGTENSVESETSRNGSAKCLRFGRSPIPPDGRRVPDQAIPVATIHFFLRLRCRED